MTINKATKSAAREYADANGVSYTAALRAVTAGTPPAPTGWTLHPESSAGGYAPYPYHIRVNGRFVGAQHYWKGDPFRLVGFAEPQTPYEVELSADSVFANPEACIGLVPVFVDRHEHHSTDTTPIARVTPFYTPAPDRKSAVLVVSNDWNSPDGFDEITVEVGHIIAHLNAADRGQDGTLLPSVANEVAGIVSAMGNESFHRAFGALYDGVLPAVGYNDDLAEAAISYRIVENGVEPPKTPPTYLTFVFGDRSVALEILVDGTSLFPEDNWRVLGLSSSHDSTDVAVTLSEDLTNADAAEKFLVIESPDGLHVRPYPISAVLRS